jgi:UDP-N-acetylmuramoyl-L-alanyl-D-glutamate--2,6-diaminopimelate ligase
MTSLTLLRDLDATVAWLRDRGALALATDSRRVQRGDAFIAWPGYGVDARQFVPSALKNGAVACLVEADGADAFALDGAVCAAVPDLKSVTGELAHRFHGRPSEHLEVFAVTGTNGKTSCAWWVAQAMSLLGRRCGVIGTLGVGEPPSAAAPQAAVVSTGLTTPDPVTLQASFRRFVDAGFEACAMEASSIGIVEQRLAGARIDVAMFTNFTRDHLDFHGGMAAYWEAKARLFAWPGLRAAVINVDDEQGATLARQLDDRGLDLWTFSAQAHHAARLQARHIHYQAGGLSFTLNEGPHTVAVHTGLIGDYNAANVLAVIGALRAAGVPLADAAAVCASLTPVPGRMQRVPGAEGPEVVVDYAHTPDALEKAIDALRPLAQARGGQLWTVFGCGGDRDATKRPLMGAIAAERSDHVVVTSDNPRSENPAEILRQIAAGMGAQAPVMLIEDRRAAIAHAVNGAKAHDVVLVAGKGHEAEQEVAGVKHPFSDVAEALAALARRAAR